MQCLLRWIIFYPKSYFHNHVELSPKGNMRGGGATFFLQKYFLGVYSGEENGPSYPLFLVALSLKITRKGQQGKIVELVTIQSCRCCKALKKTGHFGGRFLNSGSELVRESRAFLNNPRGVQPPGCKKAAGWETAAG